MKKMNLCLSVIFMLGAVDSFSPSLGPRSRGERGQKALGLHGENTDLGSMGLPPKLEAMVSGLRSLPDDKMRVRQVLYLAEKATPFDSALKVNENKVPGCLSTVHVHASLTGGRIFLQGDSDAQLTKGLVTLLTDGISGKGSRVIFLLFFVFLFSLPN